MNIPKRVLGKGNSQRGVHTEVFIQRCSQRGAHREASLLQNYAFNYPRSLSQTGINPTQGNNGICQKVRDGGRAFFVFIHVMMVKYANLFFCLSIFSLANSQQFRVVEFRKKFFSLTQKMEVVIILKRWKENYNIIT